MEDRMRLMKEIQERNPKSYCPSCGAPNKCAIELGKSASTCWCMTLDKDYNPDTQYDLCLCHNCLTKEEEINE